MSCSGIIIITNGRIYTISNLCACIDNVEAEKCDCTRCCCMLFRQIFDEMYKLSRCVSSLEMTPTHSHMQYIENMLSPLQWYRITHSIHSHRWETKIRKMILRSEYKRNMSEQASEKNACLMKFIVLNFILHKSLITQCQLSISEISLGCSRVICDHWQAIWTHKHIQPTDIDIYVWVQCFSSVLMLIQFNSRAFI